MTRYIHRVTLVVPAALINWANHLACIMGESPADINTFHECNWQDAEGSLYAAASTVVTPRFLGAATGVLPVSRDHAADADRGLAQQALDTLNQPGGIQMIVDVEPLDALAGLRLSLVPQELEQFSPLTN